jgi:hypothetical protein
MGYALAQAVVGSQNASSALGRTNTFGSAAAVNNLIVVAAIVNGGTNPTLSVSDGVNTYTQAGTNNFTAGNTREYVWTAVNVSATALAVTVTPSAAGFVSFAIMEFAGGATSSVQDGSAATYYATGGSTAPATTALTVSQANDLIVGILTHNGTVTALTPGANYTQAYENEATTNMPINVTDTNFGARVRVPNNRVGPMALRRLYRSPAYPFDSTVSTGTTTNRRRRVICAGA